MAVFNEAQQAKLKWIVDRMVACPPEKPMGLDETTAQELAKVAREAGYSEEFALENLRDRPLATLINAIRLVGSV